MNSGTYNREMPERYTGAIVTHTNIIGVTSHYLNWIYGPLHEMEPITYTDEVGKNLKLNRSWALEEILLL